jgi:hypothetical protein
MFLAGQIGGRPAQGNDFTDNDDGGVSQLVPKGQRRKLGGSADRYSLSREGAFLNDGGGHFAISFLLAQLEMASSWCMPM